MSKKEAPIKPITLTVDDILANGMTGKSGKLYMVESELSMARKEQFDLWFSEYEMGMSPEKTVKKLDSVIDYFNHYKMGTAIYELMKYRDGVNDLKNRPRLLMMLCSVFMNEKEEDSTTISETKIAEKVKDLDHYTHNTFFLLLLSMLPGLMGSSEQSSPNTSGK